MKTTSLVTLFVMTLMVSRIPADAQAPDWIWAKTFGTNTQMFDERGEAIAVDASGNVYTAGIFTGTIDFDPGANVFNMTSAGNGDIFLLKLDAAGNFIWAKQIGGTGYDVVSAVTFDPTGNFIYLAGGFQATVDFDPGAGSFMMTTGGTQDIFICKLDIAANFIWAKKFSGTSTSAYTLVNGLDLDAAGNVYTTGYFDYTVDFDPGAGTAYLTPNGSPNFYDIFISKLDASGNFTWVKRIGGSSNEVAHSICVDRAGSGDVYTTGYFSGTVDFDPGAGTSDLISAGQLDVFISRLDAAGNFVWAKSFGGSSSQQANAIITDPSGSGDLLVTGGFYGTADFDPDAGVSNLTSAGIDDIFIARFNSSGALLWANRAGSTSWDEGTSVAIDAAGNIFTTGFFSGTVDFNSDSLNSYELTSIGDSDVFVSKTDASGNLLWVSSAGGMKGETGLAVALNSAGDAHVCGYYRSSTVAFSAITLANADVGGSLVSDAFVAKLDHTTGLESIGHGKAISLYPNPADGQFTIDLPGGGNKTISIFNTLGEKIFSATTERVRTTINCKLFPAGIYFVRVDTSRGAEVKKLIVE